MASLCSLPLKDNSVEICKCPFSNLNSLIQMDCSKSLQPLENNLIDFDEIKCSNDMNYFIELTIQNKILDFDLIKSNSGKNNTSLMKFIKTLTIANNKIIKIDQEATNTNGPFEYLINLNKLSLNSNNINEINFNWFKNINPYLKQLNLSSNQLKIIKNNSFLTLNKLEILTSLKEFRLSSNELRRIKMRH